MSGLRAGPVRRCRRAGYPTRAEVRERPELLAEHVPGEWVGKRELAGILAAALAVQAGGCSERSSPPGAARAAKPAQAVVAPVFEHGSGRAAVGGDGYDWAIFLSEDEAIQIIREELNAAGLQMTQTAVPVEGVVIPRRTEGGDGEQPKQASEPGRLLIGDLQDPVRGVVVEYASTGMPANENEMLWQEGKYQALGGEMSSSTVQSYDFREVAQYVSEQVGKSGKGIYFGAFYDPATEVNFRHDWVTDSQSADPKGAAAESKRMLRLQVRDFVEWLKGQGVI